MVKVLISLPEDLLERIDRDVEQQRTSRSRFLQDAAARQLGWPSEGAIDAALMRARAALASAGGFESADLIAEERKSRDAADRRR